MQIIFYPISFLNNRINGIGIGDHIPFQSSVVPITDFYLLKFFTPEIFFFQMKLDQLGFPKEEYKYNVFVFINNGFENYPISNSKSQFCEYVDKYTKRPNPLKHIVAKSKKIDDRRKKCISLAMDFGFPLINIVSFTQNTLLRSRDEIEKQWDNIITSQHGSLENDFVSTLKGGVVTIADEYSGLFTELDRISEENPFLVAEPLFSFLNIYPEISLLSHITPPKIFFDQVLIKAIFSLRKECANEYSKALSSEFKNKEYLAKVRHSIITKSKRKDRYRIRFLIRLTFPGYVELSRARWRLEEVRDIILSRLGEVDPEAYEIFHKSRMEIWLKKVRVDIIIHENFEKETTSLIRENFRGTLSSKSIFSRSISKNLMKISFKLSFDKITDYSISETDIFYDISDKYTRLAVEKLYRGEFSEASNYLKMGRYGLLGDLYTIKSRESGSLNEFSEKALNYYSISGIDNLNTSKGYLDNKFKDKVLTAIEVNSDWMISLRLFLKAKDLEKDTSFKESLKKEDAEKRLWWEHLHRKYSELNIDRSLDNFIEKIGNFYSILLVNLQRKHGIPPREMLGFDF